MYLLQILTKPVAKGFKGLVAHAKYNRDSYESELEFYFNFSRIFVFILLENEQKLKPAVKTNLCKNHNTQSSQNFG